MIRTLWRILLGLCLLSGLVATLASGRTAPSAHTPGAENATLSAVRAVRIAGGISPAQADLLREALDAAERRGEGMLVVVLDTPGGSGEAMRDMVKTILAAPVPVAVWVGPAGARAASAGVFLVAAADLAAMSPQTTIGAASPVGMDGGDLQGTMQAKVKNDIMSFVRGVAQARGRNTDWYEDAVDKAVSITAEEAVLERVVDLLAESVDDLLAQAGSRGVTFRGRTVRFDPEAVTLVEHDPGFRHRVLSWLIDPQIAYFLMLGGMAGLFFELTTPGAVLPGVVGGLCLLLALYAMSVLPTNAAGLLLVLFGLVLFFLELHITSYGMLSVAGVAALFLGSTILFRPGEGFEALDMATISVTVAGLSCLLLAAVWLAARAQRARPAGGLQAMVGEEGAVLSWDGPRGLVRVRGEIWSAVSAAPLAPGDRVRVAAARGLILDVTAAPPVAARTNESEES